MKKHVISAMIVFLFFGMILSPILSGFEIEETLENQEYINEDGLKICPVLPVDKVIHPDLGTIKIEMKETEGEYGKYPILFDVDVSGILSPTIEITVPNKYSSYPIIQPQLHLLVNEQRQEHPEYRFVILFFATGSSSSETWLQLALESAENDQDTLDYLMEFSSSGFHPFPWESGERTFHPKIEIYKHLYTPVLQWTKVYEKSLTFSVNVTIDDEKPDEKIFINHSLPYQIITIFRSLLNKLTIRDIKPFHFLK
jgi:hypothetical protein